MASDKYDHIMEVWLDAAAPDHPVALALRRGNYTTMRRLENLSRTPGDIDKLRYVPQGETDERELDDEQKEDIHAVHAYHNFLQNEHGPSSECGKIDITLRDREDFLDYVSRIFDASNPTHYDDAWARRSMQARAIYARTTTSTTAAPATATTTTSSPDKALQQWDKGVKRDASAFPTLTKDYEFDDFWLKFKAIAKAQQVDKVLDPTYTPPAGSIEEDLLQRMNEFVYSVLTTHIQTTRGEQIVKDFEDTTDAQKACEKLVKHHMESIAATKRADKLFRDITSTSIPDVREYTYEKYISRFRGKVRQYNKIADTPMDAATELTHLKNYVSGHNGMKQVSTTANLMKAMVGKPLDPGKYIELFEEQAQELDGEHKKRMFGQQSARDRERKAMLTQALYSSDYSDDDYHVVSDDEDTTYGAFAAEGSKKWEMRYPARRPSLSKETWRALCREDQIVWDRMSLEGKKTIILSLLRRTANTNGTETNPNEIANNDGSNPDRKELLTPDKLSQDRAARRGTVDANVTEFIDDEEVITLDANGTTLIDSLCEVNQASHLKPYDLHRFMSQPLRPGKASESARMLKNGEKKDDNGRMKGVKFKIHEQ